MFNSNALCTLLMVILCSNANASTASSVKESKLGHMAKCQTLLPNEREYKLEISVDISKKTKLTGELYLTEKDKKLKEEDYKELKPFLDCTLNFIKTSI